jgi:hypothetical protein
MRQQVRVLGRRLPDVSSIAASTSRARKHSSMRDFIEPASERDVERPLSDLTGCHRPVAVQYVFATSRLNLSGTPAATTEAGPKGAAERRSSTTQANAAGSIKSDTMETTMKLFLTASFLAAALGSSAALAQTGTLPLQSPAERQVLQTDRAIRRELQQTQQEDQQMLQHDQTQSEINQLRLQNHQHEMFGPSVRYGR